MSKKKDFKEMLFLGGGEGMRVYDTSKISKP